MNRNERTFKELAAFIAERYLWNAGGRVGVGWGGDGAGGVVTVTQRVKLVAVEFAFDLGCGLRSGKPTVF
jgi:hypothetical protein